MATVVRFQAKPSQFFAIFDSLVAIITHPGAQNSRSGSFGADNDAGQTDKPIALPRFAHARGVMNSDGHYLVVISVAKCSDRHHNLTQISLPGSDLHYSFFTVNCTSTRCCNHAVTSNPERDVFTTTMCVANSS